MANYYDLFFFFAYTHNSFAHLSLSYTQQNCYLSQIHLYPAPVPMQLNTTGEKH